jgi:DNA adenine methylase
MTKSLTLQPIPYQGSKRKIAGMIFSYAPKKIKTLYEPFAGSAAISLFAANNRLAEKYVINDSYEPLADLLKKIVEDPEKCASEYGKLWRAQIDDREKHYAKVRKEFNEDKDPVKFLFLVTKCVKNAIRFNSSGHFNQSSDKRRLGRSPEIMRKHLIETSMLLKNKSIITSGDYAEILKMAKPGDLVYMDPPYQGTSTKKNPRYHQGIDVQKLIIELEKLNKRGVSYLLSFDGQLGEKKYGEYLPDHLNLKRIDINMGRSSQSTLSGGNSISIESLYLSPDLSIFE